MPYVNKYIRGNIDIRNPSITIPLIYYQTVGTIWKQIISENLYWNLRAASIPWTLLSTGDFLIHNSSTLQIVNDQIAEFYELPPPIKCKGETILITFSASVRRISNCEIVTNLLTEISSVCYGSTSLVTFINSNSNDSSVSVSTILTTDIL